MGLGLFGGSSYCSCTSPKEDHVHNFGNPDPKNYQILEVYDAPLNACAVRIKYPDAKNYEGIKILVYRHPWRIVQETKTLDPHFCNNPQCVSPFARFEPTEKGWKLAKQIARII